MYFWLCWLFSSCGNWGLFIVVCGLLIAVPLMEHGLQVCGLQQVWQMGSGVVHRISPESPALADGVFTTSQAPVAKFFIKYYWLVKCERQIEIRLYTKCQVDKFGHYLAGSNKVVKVFMQRSDSESNALRILVMTE